MFEIIISFVQGITEFIPISSSMHIAIVSEIFFDIDYLYVMLVCHFGSLSAIIIYGILKYKNEKYLQILRVLILCFIPITIVGLISKIFLNIHQTLLIMSISNLIFGIMLYISDTFEVKINKFEDISSFKLVIIGIFQCASIIPGSSRSGAIITASRIFKISKELSLDIAYITSMPTLSAATLLMLISDFNYNQIEIYSSIQMFFMSMIVSLLVLYFLRKIVSSIGYKAICIYRVFVSTSLLIYLLINTL